MCVDLLNDSTIASDTGGKIGIKKKMPTDFNAYLLSVSPPGFELHYRRYMHLRDDRLELEEMGRKDRNNFYPVKVKPQLAKANGFDLCTYLGELSINTVTDYSECNVEAPESVTLNNTKQTSPPKPKKSVSFADENGYALSSIREFSESPNSPPTLRRGLLSSLTRGAKAGVTEKTPLVIQFPQPASDYCQFREKLERLYVSLENVILKDYNLLGTVKVKNIAFEKKLKIRCTFDSWETFTDLYATFVSSRPQNTHSPYDTFSFEISVAPNFDPKKSIQFVICYEVDGKEYWDNNNDVNYVVSSRDWNSLTDSESEDQLDGTVFTLNTDSTNWPQYSSWGNTDSTIPYW